MWGSLRLAPISISVCMYYHSPIYRMEGKFGGEKYWHKFAKPNFMLQIDLEYNIDFETKLFGVSPA